MLTITPLPAFTDNYIWLLIDAQQQQAVVVDPGDAAPVERMLSQQELTLSAILITHHHTDHTGGISALTRNRQIPVIGPKSIPSVTQAVSDKDIIPIDALNLSFEVLAVPGHTLDHIAYYNAPQNLLFCGDTLFAAGCGRIFEGTPEQMFASLQKIAVLPNTTQIYCAHEYTEANLAFAAKVEPKNSAIQQRIKKVRAVRSQSQPSLPSILEEELMTNPFLRCQETSLHQIAEQHSHQKITDSVQVFAIIRKWKDLF